jgi:N-acetylglucosaminyldiphosphoundecaprenol N-acetyl-beta-D-mannosaminyltransferase
VPGNSPRPHPGSYVTPLSAAELLHRMDAGITDRTFGRYAIFFEGNLLSRLDHDESLRKSLEKATFVLPDGIAPALLCSWLTGRPVQRLPGPNFMPLACEYGVSRGWRHYFYGGQPDVAARVAATLSSRFPGMVVAGCDAPPFRPLSPEEDAAVCRTIERSGADIVWVALGGPKQEIWMHEHSGRLKVPMMLGVGAAFDFLVDTQPRAPRFVQRLGCEWLYRMCTGGPRIFRRNLRAALGTLFILARERLRHAFARPRAPGGH